MGYALQPLRLDYHVYLLPYQCWRRGNQHIGYLRFGSDDLLALHYYRRLLHLQQRPVRNNARRLRVRSDDPVPGHHPAVPRDTTSAGTA